MFFDEALRDTDEAVYDALVNEEKRQVLGLELIPSENYVSPAVLEALGSAFTNKYSEGYPGKRYYGGNEFTDVIENLARDRAKDIFGAEHVNVQPLSGSPMNQAVYLGLLEPGDTILGMDLSHGGHLTHGAPVSHMGKLFNFIRYKTDPNDGGKISEDELMALAKEHQPKLVLCGHSSYPRDLDYAMFKRVADSVGALTMADVSHIGGLIAAGVLRNPITEGFDIMTTTTHKTLRGPRGGMILCKKKFAKDIDKSVFPGLQGGPHMNQVAAVAVSLLEAMQPEFKEYGKQVVANAATLADSLKASGATLVTGGTENHMIVINTVESFSIDGHTAQEALDTAGITVNKQIIPDDPNPPMKPSGVRLGTPALTTRGMKEAEMEQVAAFMVRVLSSTESGEELSKIREEVEGFCDKFPVPGITPESK